MSTQEQERGSASELTQLLERIEFLEKRVSSIEEEARRNRPILSAAGMHLPIAGGGGIGRF